MSQTDTESIKDALKQPRLKRHTFQEKDLLSTGSTLLNLACSGSINGGLCKGRYFWMVGDSSSGKTMLTLTILAEASINPSFDNYDLIYDDVEGGALMDVEQFFGKKLAERLSPPFWIEDTPDYSRTAEDFYFGLDSRLTDVESGEAKPFIWILDSMDALSTKYEGEKFAEKKKAWEEEKKPKGDYGDGKAKINSTWIRSVVPRLRDTGSILVILSQTRDNINASMFESSSTHAGGRSLKFYAAWQLWSSLGKAITKQVKGKNRQLGIVSRIAIKKNRLTGRETTGDTVVQVPIYHSFGIDDIGSCVDYLVEEGHWAGSGNVHAAEFDFKGRRERLIRMIEEDEAELELKSIVKKVWTEIQQACIVDRKNRY